MVQGQYLPVNTASPKDSIWQEISQTTFRQNIVTLEQASKKVPGKKGAASGRDWEKTRHKLSSLDYILPFSVEQQLADDFAFLAAAEQGAKAISAVCIEEESEPVGLIVRLAANDPVAPGVQEAVQRILELLVDCAKKRLPRKDCKDNLFDIVIRLNRDRIHARLQSTHWKRPQYIYKGANGLFLPLYQEINQIAAKLQSSRCCCSSITDPLRSRLNALSETYRSIDDPFEQSEEEIEALKTASRQSNEVYQWWASWISSNNASRDKKCCFSKASMQQIGKIGRYWSLCANLASAARKYRDLFENIRSDILTPYQPTGSNISSKKPPVSCHVHAEVQMVAFYETGGNHVSKRPRIIGSSRAACYLCNLFIHCHGTFFLSQTHGQLHDQWTVPDLARYSPAGRKRLRTTLAEMNSQIKRAIISQTGTTRNFPLMSWLDLRDRLFSPGASSSKITPPHPAPARSNPSTKSASSSRNISSRPATASTIRPKNLQSTPPSSVSSFPLPPRPESQRPSPASVSDHSTSTRFLTSKDISSGQDIDEDTILHVMANKIWMDFEMEGPRRGHVSVRPSPPADGAPIDYVARVEDIADGSQIRVAKRAGSKCVNLELVYGCSRPVFVSLKWY